MNPENKNKQSLLLSRWKQYSCDAQFEEQVVITIGGDIWRISTTRACKFKKNGILKKIKKVARSFSFMKCSLYDAIEFLLLNGHERWPFSPIGRASERTRHYYLFTAKTSLLQSPFAALVG